MKTTATPDIRLAPVLRAAPARTGVTRRRLMLGGLGAAGLAAGTAGYAIGIEAFELKITEYHLALPAWPAGRRLSIGVVADIHAGGPNMLLDRVRQIVDATNALGCDLIVLLGDYVANHRFVTEVVPPEAWSAELQRLTAPLGVYAILGNHDWWFHTGQSRHALESVRIPVMQNDAVLIGSGAEKFWLAGLGDQVAYRLGRGRYRGVDDLPGTLKKITTDDPAILLAHEPDIFPHVPDRIALTLAGHTHGGQVRVPLLWPYFVPSQYRDRFAYGHIIEDNRHMVVSGGLGTSVLPARMGVPPEILRIVLGGGGV